MAKTPAKKGRILVVFRGLMLKKYIMKRFRLSEEEWFELFGALKRKKILVDNYRG